MCTRILAACATLSRKRRREAGPSSSEMAADHPGKALLDQCRALNSQGLYQSAAALASFLVGARLLDSEVFTVYGDSLFGLGEPKRALSAYRSALELMGGMNESSDGAVEWVELVWKVAECQRLLGDYSGQKMTLEQIPGHLRSLKVEKENPFWHTAEHMPWFLSPSTYIPASRWQVNIALGNLYRRFGSLPYAIACFQASDFV